MRMFLRMKCENFVLAAEIPCEWKFATKLASDCECDGSVHSGTGISSGRMGLLEKRSCQNAPCCRDSEEVRETVETLQNVGKQGESHHFLEILSILENLDYLEILEFSSVQRPLLQ